MKPLVLTRGDIPGAAWPVVHSHKTASLAAQIHQLEATQWLSADEIAAGQRAQLGALAAYFAGNVPSFAARLKEAGMTAADLPANLAALPLLDRRAAQSGLGEKPSHALPAGHGPVAKVSTSGSTGVSVTVWKTALNQLDWLALTVRYYRWSEPDFRVRLAAIRALIRRNGAYADWGAPLANLVDTGPMLALDIATDLDEQIAQLAAFDPQSLIVYPSNLDAMMTRMGARRFPALQRIRSVGEQLSPAIRERVSAEWGLPVFDCYSSEEIGYLALQCPEGAGYHVMDEMLIVELVDDKGRPVKPGKVGRVIVTDLRNYATPMIRYDISDYAVRGKPCGCGRGLSTLERIMGRERNMIRNPDGTTHWPLTGHKEYRGVAPIVQYQMVQHALDEIELRLVTERALTAGEEGALRDLLLKKLGHPFRIAFTYYDEELPKGPRGKFEEFVSMIGARA